MARRRVWIKLCALLLAVLMPCCGSFPSAEAAGKQGGEQDDFLEQAYSILKIYAGGDGTITEETAAMLNELEQLDPVTGSRWRDLLEYMQYVNTEMPIETEAIPEDLPEDGSLCIVVLGYQLSPYGRINKPLEERLKAAYQLALRYPNAKIAVTGGPTASKNRRACEGSAMAAWLEKRGIAQDRIIVERRAMSTADNAVKTAALLERYPEIKELVVVTSDYHLRRSCVVFAAQMILGGKEPRVVASFASKERTGHYTIYDQVSDIKYIVGKMKENDGQQ